MSFKFDLIPIDLVSDLKDWLEDCKKYFNIELNNESINEIQFEM